MMPVKDPDESVIVEFDFEGELDSVASAVVEATVHSGGSDPDPSGILYGSPQIVGDKVFQRIIGGISGVTYGLRCEGTSSLDVIVRAELLPVKTRIQTN